MTVRQKLGLFAIVVFAGGTFFTGINWGLPSRQSDRFLFGGRAPWTGRQIMQLAGAWDTTTSRGADIAMHPLTAADKPVVLNDSDAKRAEIVRRYRLYSNQPDEMITFRSLSRMKPGKLDFDPAMYQYGGLWIYPIGVLLRLASICHLVTLRTDLAFYLDHPEAFARFYLVARIYSAMWGLLGVMVVYAVGREWSGRFVVGAVAAGLYAAAPVVIDLSHEAKPHLAGTVLTLLAVLCAMRYVRTGLGRWWIGAGVFAGASLGMVLTGYTAFAVLPVMALLRPMPWGQRLRVMTKAVLIGLGIFAISNPYLPFNLLFHRGVLHSNMGNYGTFYQPALSREGLAITGKSLIEGVSPVVFVVAVLGVLAGLLKITLRRAASGSSLIFADLRPSRKEFEPQRRGDAEKRKTRTTPIATKDSVAMEESSVLALSASLRLCGSDSAERGIRYEQKETKGWLLLAVTVPVLIQFILLAAGKTAEYGRFALTVDVVLCLLAARLVGTLPISNRERGFAGALLVASTFYFGLRYEINFVCDNRRDSTRMEAADFLEKSAVDTIAVWAEPAPYCLPPVNLFDHRIELQPRGTELYELPAGTVAVRPVDAPRLISAMSPRRASSPISWANKPFEIMSAPVSTSVQRP